jgi:hypothetical protein
VGFIGGESVLAGMISPDYCEIYNLETYLLETVRCRFQTQGWLSAFDFFCIIIWKANRAKTRIAKRLLTKVNTNSLEIAARQLTMGLFKQSKPMERLRYLMTDWGFLLPMASAILTILYPDDFTVYDIRVCDELGEYHHLANITDFNKLWRGYLEFRDAVNQAAPTELSLRDKDRYLWGKSFTQQLRKNILDGFNQVEANDD